MSEMVNRHCTLMMEDTVFVDAVRRTKFDLAVVDAFLLSPCNTILPHHLGVPFVSLTVAFFPWHIRLPTLPSFAALPGPWKNTDRMTFRERVANTFGFVIVQRAVLFPGFRNQTLLQRYSNSKGSINSWDALIRKSELILLPRDHHL